MGPRERNSRTRAKTHAVPIIVASFFGFMLIAGVAFGIGMLGNVNKWLQDLPDYSDTDLYLTSEPTNILDAQGNTIATLYSQNRKSVTMEEVSPYVLTGTVDTEDERFYEHPGVDIVGIARAVVVQLTGGHEGASTITQQLVRNTILSDEQFDDTLERKVREAYIALEMEKIYSKDEILMMYLNTIYYGHGAYGIEAAANTYFSKSSKDLTLAEAALLVGLPNAPSRYDPTTNPEYALQRRNTVLDRMLSNGDITQEEHDAAQAEEIVLNVSETSGTGVDIFAQPYFVDYVRQLLSEEFSYDSIFSGGLTVETTINPTVQAAAEQSVADTLNSRQSFSGLEAGMVVIDPDTGYIVAMVGGRDYNSDPHHVNHALAQRQPGSSFKPITLTAAIEAGMNPNMMFNCNSPQMFDNGKYRVQNVSNMQYGTISLARATEVSSNTGYVQVAKAIGNDRVIDMARRLGITADLPDVSSLTLGVASISPLEMAEAYSTIASGGYHRDPVAITKITNRNGEVVYEHEDAPEKVVDTGVTQVVTEILEGVVNHRGGTATSAHLSVNQPYAGKTGTTTNTVDLWYCSFTPQYVASVWVGYSQGNTMIRGGSNLNLTIPIARAFFNAVLQGVPREEFPTGNTPSYRDDSVWEVEGKSVVQRNEEAETPETEEEPATTEEGAETPPGSTDQPATTPTEPDPDPDTGGDPDPDPDTGTNPPGGEVTPPPENTD